MTYQDYFRGICGSIPSHFHAVNIITNTLGDIGILGKVEENTIEVPFVACPPLLNSLSKEYVTGDYIIPFGKITHAYGSNAKSTAPLFKQFFYDNNGSSVFTSRLGKDVKYFGSRGIILYEDNTPLVLFTLVLKKSFLNNSTAIKFCIDKVKVYINPLIYTKNDLMAKGIRTKMLEELIKIKQSGTLLGSTRYSSPFNSTIDISENIYVDTLEVLISNEIYNFIKVPRVPDINTNDEVLQQCIVANSDLI